MEGAVPRVDTVMTPKERRAILREKIRAMQSRKHEMRMYTGIVDLPDHMLKRLREKLNSKVQISQADVIEDVRQLRINGRSIPPPTET
jgi:hypothetical protein